MNIPLKILCVAAIACALGACEQSGSGSAAAISLSSAPAAPKTVFPRSGRIQSTWLDEISGIQASRSHAGVLWVHDDDGYARVGATGYDGADRGFFEIEDGDNRDWEDITLVPRDDGDLLVLANTGDNKMKYKSVWLYFVKEPEPGPDGVFDATLPIHHKLRMRFPDSRQDTEAVAYDPLGDRLLFITKRSHPPRLYGLDLETALTEEKVTLEFLAEVDNFRPPDTVDRGVFGKRTPRVSQPTGMDISPDGSRAAIITYRSLYLFELGDQGDWVTALQGERTEIPGPDELREEAVTFSPDGQMIFITSEGANPPLFQFTLP